MKYLIMILILFILALALAGHIMDKIKKPEPDEHEENFV